MCVRDRVSERGSAPERGRKRESARAREREPTVWPGTPILLAAVGAMGEEHYKHRV